MTSEKAHDVEQRVNALVMNTRVAYPVSGDTSGAKDTAAIQQLLNGGRPASLGPGTYYLNAALSLPTGAILQGAGMGGVTILSPTTNSMNVLAMTDKRYIAVRDLQILGPGSGTGRGISFAHSAAALASISIRNVWIKDMGGSGAFCDTLITSDLTNVRVETCGADNIYITNSTSTTLSSCYANGPTASSSCTGFRINNCRYMALSACAADNVTDANGAYFIQGGEAITFSGCGCENPVTGFKVTSSASAIKFAGCRVLGLTGTGYLITSTSVNCSIDTCSEVSPGAGATASIKVDTGSSAVVINPDVVTAQSYAASTAYVITKAGGTVH